MHNNPNKAFRCLRRYLNESNVIFLHIRIFQLLSSDLSNRLFVNGFEMHIGCFGLPISTSTIFLLCTNLVVNNYNLLLISLNSSNLQFVKLLQNNVAYNWYLILIETILILSAIVSINTAKSSSKVKNIIKYWCYGFTVALLFLEIMAFLSFSTLVYCEKAVNKIWENIGDENRKKVITIEVLHTFVAVAIACFFAFKLYTAIAVFCFATSSANHISWRSHDSIDDDIEQFAARHRRREEISSSPPYNLTHLHWRWIQLAMTPPPPSPPPSYRDAVRCGAVL